MHPATEFASADPEICCCCGTRDSASCRDKFQARSVCGLSLTEICLQVKRMNILQGKTHKLVKALFGLLDTPHKQADYKHDGSISSIPS